MRTHMQRTSSRLGYNDTDKRNMQTCVSYGLFSWIGVDVPTH